VQPTEAHSFHRITFQQAKQQISQMNTRLFRDSINKCGETAAEDFNYKQKFTIFLS